MLELYNIEQDSIQEVLYIEKSCMSYVIKIRDIQEWENNHSYMYNKADVIY